MIFRETALPGAFTVDIQEHRDERGLFARTFCAQEFEAHGLNPLTVQTNLSFNARAGTLRGLHYQLPPAAETKLVRCTRGAVLDVIVDLRPESPTYLQHVAVELSADNRRALFVPQRFAHGYQTLTDDAEVSYQVSEYYQPGAERGLRFDDPALGIRWPLPPGPVSAKDAAWPLLTERGDLPLPARPARAVEVHP
ncbi:MULTISPECIES: dTDP-4-dehydrorhamnose 3,5-epimerase [unclassified Deinococcus]|jgi:dTDP-4-dehydrorhamnose 3,5-epimerase|uniref:dTDP-4-dehydrorhamnose 3,5-epimerase n=1 Tax=unclassified Deinococcus TaxID=2623546 RepID=UPI001E3BA5D1|nr:MULTISPECIES: dTDP-4-dehydrorhamnose 3,5-epimerase [unclassified Deinococcus]MCD0170410.1 dTDP-4-dehydrorhamnose 3,5-epimerase [Deinococcus sp. 23YEL01]MCD0176431.1 dTDP-4-dehydrorhamnose 3,5-epimerase [Deinococcus sp. 14RED07]